MALNRFSLVGLFLFYLISADWSLEFFIKSAHSQEVVHTKDRFKCEELARQAEERYKLPKNILLSISRVESGYGKVDGITRSWPWTLNAGGNSAYFETEADAIKDLKEKLKRGVRNVDLGCMQINYKWHKKFFKSVSQMIDPYSNVDYGARFLKRLYQRHGSWDIAIKYYHSKKSKFNKSYLKKVKAVWQKENNNKWLSDASLITKYNKIPMGWYELTKANISEQTLLQYWAKEEDFSKVNQLNDYILKFDNEFLKEVFVFDYFQQHLMLIEMMVFD